MIYFFICFKSFQIKKKEIKKRKRIVYVYKLLLLMLSKRSKKNLKTKEIMKKIKIKLLSAIYIICLTKLK